MGRLLSKCDRHDLSDIQRLFRSWKRPIGSRPDVQAQRPQNLSYDRGGLAGTGVRGEQQVFRRRNRCRLLGSPTALTHRSGSGPRAALPGCA